MKNGFDKCAFLLFSLTASAPAVFSQMEDAAGKNIIWLASLFNLLATRPSKHLADSLPPHSCCLCVISNC